MAPQLTPEEVKDKLYFHMRDTTEKALDGMKDAIDDAVTEFTSGKSSDHDRLWAIVGVSANVVGIAGAIVGVSNPVAGAVVATLGGLTSVVSGVQKDLLKPDNVALDMATVNHLKVGMKQYIRKARGKTERSDEINPIKDKLYKKLAALHEAERDPKQKEIYHAALTRVDGDGARRQFVWKELFPHLDPRDPSDSAYKKTKAAVKELCELVYKEFKVYRAEVGELALKSRRAPMRPSLVYAKGGGPGLDAPRSPDMAVLASELTPAAFHRWLLKRKSYWVWKAKHRIPSEAVLNNLKRKKL